MLMSFTLTNTIPKIQPRDFKNTLKSLKINPEPKHMRGNSWKLGYASGSRKARQDALMNMAKFLNSYGVEYVPDNGIGYVFVASTKTRFYMKPENTSMGITLKPNLFGKSTTKLVDKEIPYRDYPKAIITAIEDTKQLSNPQREVLIGLVEFMKEGRSADVDIKELMLGLGSSVSIKTVNNDFGEILGPIAIIEHQLLPIDARTAKIFLPSRGNEPLIDYKIIDKNRVYNVSAKSAVSGSTNTVKTGDIIDLLKSEPKLERKYKRSLHYKVLEIIKDNSIKLGPLEVVKYLKMNTNLPGLEWVEPKHLLYADEIRQQSELLIAKLSKEQPSFDFTPLFTDAIYLRVFYMKFGITKAGHVKWLIDRGLHQDISKVKKVFFRSTNYKGSAKNRLGLQP